MGVPSDGRRVHEPVNLHVIAQPIEYLSYNAGAGAGGWVGGVGYANFVPLLLRTLCLACPYNAQPSIQLHRRGVGLGRAITADLISPGQRHTANLAVQGTSANFLTLIRTNTAKLTPQRYRQSNRQCIR